MTIDLPPFTVLFDDGPGGTPLVAELAAIYGRFDLPAGRPYVAVNFVESIDGRVSFADPGESGGGEVSGFDAYDRFLMAVLRVRADAVVMGAGTLRVEPEHLWTSSFLWPEHAGLWAALRSAAGRRPAPLQVFVSSSGRVPPDAAVFAAAGVGDVDVEVVVAVTERGRAEAEARVAGRATVVVFPGEQVDLSAVVSWLHRERGVASILCEGGPTLYGTLVTAGVPHDLFLTVAPILMGDAAGRSARPSLVEGTAFRYARTPRLVPLSARRAGDHLFLRYHHAG